MPNVVHRFMVPPTGATVHAPTDAPVLRVEHDQHVPGLLDVWLLVPTDDTKADRVDRQFVYVGTGSDVPDHWTWRASTARYQGTVWHLFEIPAHKPVKGN